MILFVFEGDKREPEIFAAMEQMYGEMLEERIVYSYSANIYSLYSHMQKLGDGADILNCVRSHCKDKNDPVMSIGSLDEISQVFLFFDYDFHHHPSSKDDVNLDENIMKVREMLSFFNDETGNGKLYVNYPMVESLNYTKTLPDEEYYKYVITVAESCDFKHLTNKFSAYADYGHLSPCKVHPDIARENWHFLINQNVKKANYICKNEYSLPLSKKDVLQMDIFKSQKEKYGKDKVGVLNAFPIFLYEYFGNPILN